MCRLGDGVGVAETDESVSAYVQVWICCLIEVMVCVCTADSGVGE